MTNRIRALGAFVYDFVIGDDWTLAVGVVAALALTYGLSRTGIPVWWVLPAALVLLLPVSIWRIVRRR